MRILKYTFTILLLLILTSCEEHFYSEIEPPNNNATPKIVIHSFISPSNDKVTVSVKLSRALFSDVQVNEDDYTQIKNASVQIKNLKTSKTINLLYDDNEKNYFILAKDFTIEEKNNLRANCKVSWV